VGRDLLRSGADVGLSSGYALEVDVPAYHAMILKIKH
jgi:hypothetical protein